MDSRRKFKADLDNKRIQDMFTRKRPKHGKVKKAYDDSGPEVLIRIPSEMLPNSKQKERCRELVKPENWISPKTVVKLARHDVFKAERDNIKQKLPKQLATDRLARSVHLAINSKHLQGAMNDNDSMDSFSSDGPSRLFERKNNSKEFLRTFRSKANSIEKEIEAENTSQKSDVKLRPNFNWVEPGASEIVL